MRSSSRSRLGLFLLLLLVFFTGLGLSASLRGLTQAASPPQIWLSQKVGPSGVGTIGKITEYTIPTANSFSNYIVAGSDGNHWFTEALGDKIGRITTTGTITEYPIPTSHSNPVGITAGPGCTLWFVERQANKIGEITAQC